jgi:hypothetical protein
MSFILAYIFARIGSKRVISGFDSFFLVLFLSVIGIAIVLNSRRLDDERRDKELMEEFKSR